MNAFVDARMLYAAVAANFTGFALIGLLLYAVLF